MAGSKVSVAGFSGSASSIITNFNVGVLYWDSVTIRAAASISAPVNGSSGWGAAAVSSTFAIVLSIVMGNTPPAVIRLAYGRTTRFRGTPRSVTAA